MQATISSARRTAPGMPSAAGVNTISAPNAFKSRRRSRLMLSGIVTINRYPRAAQVKARPMPVLPLVGSIIKVSGLIRPAASASLIMFTPIRSFTDQSGLKFSNLASTSPTQPVAVRRRRISGVLPMHWVMSS